MNSRRQLLNEAAGRLCAARVPDYQLDAEWMLAHVLGIPRLQMLIEMDLPVSPEDAERFERLVTLRVLRHPLQYVLGEADFLGYTFCVDERVLIPRADTETLAEAAIMRVTDGMRVLEIGAGSGALSIAIALSCPGAQVTAVDISEDALTVARMNGERLGAQVEWVLSDLYGALDDRLFSIIVSNPPYIPSGVFSCLQREVWEEPRLALDGGADGLDFYRRIVQGLPGRLAQGGSLLLEIGDGQASAVCALLQSLFGRVDILRDLAGLERVVTGDGYAG